MKNLEYKHYFTVINGKFIWEDSDMLEYKRRNLEGKRGFAIIMEDEPRPSRNQFAYYFGGIIRSECMSSNVFAGFDEHQIHDHLFSHLRSHIKYIEKSDGTTELTKVTDDFYKYKKDDMTKYIEELIPFLLNEYGITVKPAELYKHNKYWIDPKSV